MRYLDMHMHMVQIDFTYLPGGEWPLSPLGNACFSGLSSYLYKSDEFTFPDSHTGLFPLNPFRG